MSGAVGSRGRGRRRQGRGALRSRCRCSATLDCTLPAPEDGHTHEACDTDARTCEWTALSDFDGLDEFVDSLVSIEA